MGKGTDPRTYYPCMKCGKIIPHYALEIHAFECHDRKQTELSHSYIDGLVLHAYVKIIKQPEKDEQSEKKNVKKKKELSPGNGSKKEASFGGTTDTKSLQQPEWLKKISVSFHHRIVFMNGSDMIRCKMKSYAPVILSLMDKKCAFLAVPWDAVRIAHIILYDEGIKKWIPGVTESNLLTVQAIPDIRTASKLSVELSPQFTTENLPTIKRQLHEILYCASPLGSPFTVTSGCHLPLVNVGHNIYKAVIKDVTFLEEEEPGNVVREHQSSNFERMYEDTSASYPSSFMTVDKCDGSDSVTSLTKKIGIMSMNDNESILRNTMSKDDESELSQLYLTIDRYDLGDSQDDVNDHIPVVTSTPKKNSDHLVEDLRKTLLTSKLGNQSVVEAEQIQKDNIWYRIYENTVIDVVNRNNITKEVVQEKMKYFRDRTFYEMLKIMESKLKQYESKGKDEGAYESWTGVLLYGPPGTGKTLVVQEVAKAMQIPVITLSVAHITSTNLPRSDCIKQQFRKASDCAPSILFLDELDSLCPAIERSTKNDNILPHLLKGIQKIQTSLDPVLLVGASSRPEGIAPKLRQAGRLDKELFMPLPTPQQRLHILQNLLKTCDHEIEEEGKNYIAKKTHGYSGADLAMLIKCAWVSCVQRSKAEQNIKECEGNLRLTLEDMLNGLSNVVATVLKENLGTRSKVEWKDICGYSSLKTWLKNMVDSHIDNPEKNPLKGILLYGPPGCSKTLFVKALVYYSGFSFFPVKCSDLLSKYVGETEKSLRRLFVRAQQAAPSIIFMDEVDSLCEKRSSGGSGSLISELLSLASSMCSTGNIALIGATNRPHALDEGVMCPACFAHVVHIGLPSTECRREMWMQLLCGVPTEEDLNIEHLVSASEGYTGAEIVAVYQEAAQSKIFALHNNQKMGSNLPSSKLENQRCWDEEAKLSMDDLNLVFQKVLKRTPASLLKNIEEFNKQRHVLVF